MFGEKIKSLRTRRNLTQESMAAHFNLSAQAVSKWEQNTAMPDISLLVPIADYFGVTVDFLLRENTTKLQESIVSQLEFKIEDVRKHGNLLIIFGYLKNNSCLKFESIGFKIRFMDSSGAVVDYLEDEIMNLDPGETGRFRKPWLRSASYELIKIDIETYRIA